MHVVCCAKGQAVLVCRLADLAGRPVGIGSMQMPEGGRHRSCASPRAVGIVLDDKVFWTASDCFPVERDGVDPPELLALIETRNAFRRLCMHLLEVLGLLPKEFAKKVLPVTMRLVGAEFEVTALVLAMIDAMETGRAEGRTTRQWTDVQRAHEASDDPERSEPWTDVATGRKFVG